ncbi:hypothetical protein D1641_08355 [Colidextribacter sp. OB.20]|uniref:hypothetical protein n=1 Tax=Colidextribacter sp. OB.20 TaxID=2304568 RepID=UPI00136AC65B|nr:hypothetical protein [Colidextribacter sp. OB.20]NBI10031.1 hypothetical protein [Colidextribacter sp. OB.20]
MAGWQDYLKLMRELTGSLEALAQVEREKNAAASRGDLAGVEECMRREQVMSLTLRGYDQRRDKLLSQLGLEGVTLSQLEDHSPDELQLETKAVVEELRRQYKLFQAASQVARDTLEINLRSIEQLQAKRAGDTSEAEEERKQHQTDFRA